jgi:hypothetical protein
VAISGDRRFDHVTFEDESGFDHGTLEADLGVEPVHVSWQRLEPLSLTRGALEVGLAAPVADPLWLLCRQRQFGELTAEDAGTPIDVEVSVDHAPLDRFRPGRGDGGAVRTLDPTGLIEAEAEAELVGRLPDRVRAHAGQHLLRLLRQAGAASIVDAVRLTWAFEASGEDVRRDDPRRAARRAVLAGRFPDADLISADLVDAGTVRGRPSVTLGRISIPAGLRVAVRDAVTAWRDWLDAYLYEPAAESWDASRMAYSFSASAALDDGEIVVTAGDDDSGTIDWYSFDRRPGATLDPSSGRSGTRRICRGIPEPVRYPGMPADRYWEIEDTAVFFGGIEAGPGDLAALALVDFAVQGGTDWFQIPLEVPVGSVVRVVDARVRTTFGDDIAIPPAIRADASGWSAFRLAGDDPEDPLAGAFPLPQTSRHVLAGPPLEEVDLVRDEMSNLAWAIERTVSGTDGEPVRQRDIPPSEPPIALVAEAAEVGLAFRLMSQVADNWHPLVPVVDEPGRGRRRPVLSLELRPMIRPDATGGAELRPGPIGEILSAATDDGRLRIREETIPAEGIRVTRRFEAARTSDGRYLVWVGRSRRIADTVPAAALRFDTSERPAT